MQGNNILGAILAGGKSIRMGQDKSLITLNDKELIKYTINLKIGLANLSFFSKYRFCKPVAC